MKTILSVRQPWAHLLIAGIKDIENRTWSTPYRGRLYIHASKTAPLPSDFDYIHHYFDVPPEQFCSKLPLQFGGIIGHVDLVDVVEDHESKWFEGPFGWVMRNPQPVPFRPVKGRLGLWTLND